MQDTDLFLNLILNTAPKCDVASTKSPRTEKNGEVLLFLMA